MLFVGICVVVYGEWLLVVRLLRNVFCWFRSFISAFIHVLYTRDSMDECRTCAADPHLLVMYRPFARRRFFFWFCHISLIRLCFVLFCVRYVCELLTRLLKSLRQCAYT